MMLNDDRIKGIITKANAIKNTSVDNEYIDDNMHEYRAIEQVTSRDIVELVKKHYPPEHEGYTMIDFIKREYRENK